MTAALALLAVGLPLGVGTIVFELINDGSSRSAAPIYIGLVMLLVSPFAFLRSSLPYLVRAHTSDDGTHVVFAKAHRDFIEDIRAMDTLESSP